MPKLIVSIDIGSSSVRCSAYEIVSANNIRAVSNGRTTRVVRSVQPNTGKIRLLGDSYNKSLMEKLDDCIDELLIILRDNKKDFEIVAVSFSSFVMNLVGVDSDGQIVGEEASISYACNAPSVANHCKALRSRLNEESRMEMYQNTGAPIHSAYALPQLLDIYDESSPSFEVVRSKIHKWQSIASICLSRWVGTAFLPISFSEASWTGLLNFRSCEYETSVVNLLPKSCQQTLPELADIRGSTYRIQQQRFDGTQDNPYWERWPELRHCQLFLGLGDGACANIGSKCSTHSRIAVTVGTSAAARVCLPCPVSKDATISNIQVPPGLFCYRIDSGHVLLGGALTDGGSVVEWVSELLNLKSFEELENCMIQVQQLLEKDYDKHSSNKGTPLTVVPFLSGERSTGYRDGATGAILGLTRESTPAHLLKSCLEGVTLRLKAVLLLIQKAINERTEANSTKPCIIASGKALEFNALWRQILADSCGLEVIMDGETEEGTSRGAAVIIVSALNTRSHFVDEALSMQHQSIPNVDAQEYWLSATERQEAFIDSISPLFGTS